MKTNPNPLPAEMQNTLPPLTTDQAAAYLNIAPGTLRYWRACGTGPAFLKFEGLVRYDVADLEDYRSRVRHVPSVRANMEKRRGTV